VSKETHLPELERFARAGILAVGVDAAGHGERRVADPQLHPLVDQSVRELPLILDALGAERVTLCGISFGGYIAYRGAVTDPRIESVVALLGSPDPSLADRYFPRRLLSLTAECDVNVPPDAARNFHHALEPRYASAPGRLTYHEYPGETHFLSAETWADAMARTIAWTLSR
jgi:uncharacterized protein